MSTSEPAPPLPPVPIPPSASTPVGDVVTQHEDFDATTLAPEAKGPWDDVLCTLPDCNAPLYMERRTSLTLVSGMTVADLRSDEHTSSWLVTCGEGHVLLTSGDAESASFGACAWHEAEEHDCPRRDLDRLRKIARLGPHEHIRVGDKCRDCGEPLLCSTCGGEMTDPPCSRNPETGKGGHTVAGGCGAGGAS